MSRRGRSRIAAARRSGLASLWLGLLAACAQDAPGDVPLVTRTVGVAGSSAEVASAPAGEPRTQALYRCDNSQGLLVRYSAEAPLVRIVRGVQELTLVETRGALGTRYVAPGGFELWELPGGAWFTAPGERQTSCLDIARAEP